MPLNLKNRAVRVASDGRRFAGTLVADVVRWIIKSVVLLFAFVAVASLIMPKTKPLDPDTTLYISLDRPLTEWSPFDGAPTLQFLLDAPTLSATSIVDAIESAAADANISRLVLDLDGMEGTGFGPVNRIGEALDKARAAGKQIFAYGSNMDNGQYRLALHADEVLMHPMGRFEAGGFRIGGLYLGEALQRYGVEIAVGQAGAYKSAIEPFTRAGMSPSARVAADDVLGGQSEVFLNETVARRGVSRSQIESALRSWRGDAAENGEGALAVETGLVDRLVDPPVMMDLAFGPPDHDAEGDMATIALDRYLSRKHDDECDAAHKLRETPKKERDERIGVLILEGEIRLGDAESGTVGAATAVSQIEGFARDPNNAALVVRLSTPGGDAQASDMIRSALARYRSLGRPVIVSMGTVAASGGYWIATAADKIYAEPTTITGSIGVFSLRPSAAPALEKFGVQWDAVQIGLPRSYGGVVEPIRDRERANMQADVDRVYAQFVSLVAEARDLAEANASNWAEGRVWAAETARALGLVDELGGLSDALAFAEAETGVPASCQARARPLRRSTNLLSFFLPGYAAKLAAYTDVFPITALHDGRVQALCLLCDLD